jgi:hypothetical protein
MKIETLVDLALYDLDRLGYWYLAEEAQACWETGQPTPISLYETDLPPAVLAEINLINASIQLNL